MSLSLANFAKQPARRVYTPADYTGVYETLHSFEIPILG